MAFFFSFTDLINDHIKLILGGEFWSPPTLGWDHFKGKVLWLECSVRRGPHFSSVGKASRGLVLHPRVAPVFTPTVSPFLYLCQVSLNRLPLWHVAPSGRRIEVSSALARLRDYRGAYQSHLGWLFPSPRACVKVPLQPQKWLCSLTSDRSPPSSPPVFHESVHKS